MDILQDVLDKSQLRIGESVKRVVVEAVIENLPLKQKLFKG